MSMYDKKWVFYEEKRKIGDRCFYLFYEEFQTFLTNFPMVFFYQFLGEGEQKIDVILRKISGFCNFLYSSALFYLIV